MFIMMMLVAGLGDLLVIEEVPSPGSGTSGHSGISANTFPDDYHKIY